MNIKPNVFKQNMGTAVRGVKPMTPASFRPQPASVAKSIAKPAQVKPMSPVAKVAAARPVGGAKLGAKKVLGSVAKMGYPARRLAQKASVAKMVKPIAKVASPKMARPAVAKY